MYSAIELTLFLSFCVGVKFGVLSGLYTHRFLLRFACADRVCTDKPECSSLGVNERPTVKIGLCSACAKSGDA